jgi:hypothetical protein
MEITLFDFILIILAIAIIMHLYYNSSIKIAVNYVPISKKSNHIIAEEMKNIGNQSQFNKFQSNESISSDNSSSDNSSSDNSSSDNSSSNSSSDGADESDLNKIHTIGGGYYGADLKNLTKIPTIGGTYTGDVNFPELKQLNQVPTTTQEKYPYTAISDLNEALQELHKMKSVRSNEDLVMQENADNVKKYIRERVLNGMNECECVPDKSQPEFTPEEIDSYRNQQIEFRENTYGSSKGVEGIDVVDKLNQITYNGGIPGNGMTIAQYYDSLANSKIGNTSSGFIMGTNIPRNKCVNRPNIDINANGPVGFYTGMGSGKYFKSDNWEYKNENPNNGGFYYDNIAGNDPMLDDPNLII